MLQWASLKYTEMQVGTVLEHLCKLAICSSRENSPALSSVCFFLSTFFPRNESDAVEAVLDWRWSTAQHRTRPATTMTTRVTAVSDWVMRQESERVARRVRKTISISNSWSAVTCQSCVVSTAWVAEQAATSKLMLVRRCIRHTLPPGVHRLNKYTFSSPFSAQ